MSRVVGAFLTAVLVSAVCAAQAPQTLPPGFPQAPPVRDTSAAPATAIIRGHVLDASNGRPLRKVMIRAFAPELRENRLAISDNNGAYEIKNLPAGRYQLTASKGSFVGLQYGQTRPFEQGKPLEVHDAQLLDKVDFSLPHGGIVTGRVVDEAGEPTSNVQVAMQRYQYINGRRQLSIVNIAQTNDIGEYRVFGIPPGQYFISATLRLGGGINETPPDDRSGYAPTYYPGTANVTEAQRVSLGIGQQLNDINIALSPTRMARISGTAVDSQGKPISGLLMLVQSSSGFLSTIGGQIRPDGSFTIANVTPGDYTLRAMINSGPIAGPTNEVAQAEVTVAGEDINDVRLVGIKPSSVTGRVIPPAQANNANLGQLQLLTTAKIPSPLANGGGGRVNDDGTFELMVPPGSVYVRMNTTGNFANTRIKAVRSNGVDVTDTGIDVKPNENMSGLEVELTTQLSSLSGVVSDARGKAVKDYSVVIFPRDKERWGPGSRYMNFGRPDQDGKYKALNLPPGDYYAIALDYVEQGANTDPEFLDRIKDRATEFSMTDGETKGLDLKLVTGM
jgi:protocatechuate 3,4-dioxygenase beta subunit